VVGRSRAVRTVICLGAGGDSSRHDRQARLPTEVNANVGDTVEWVNDDNSAHTATATEGDWNVVIATKQNGRLIVKKSAPVEYFCKYHPNMKGRGGRSSVSKKLAIDRLARQALTSIPLPSDQADALIAPVSRASRQSFVDVAGELLDSTQYSGEQRRTSPIISLSIDQNGSLLACTLICCLSTEMWIQHCARP
jgi:hypothetical protein